MAASGTSRKISKVTGFVVRGVEGHRLLHPQHRGERILQSLDAAVGNGHTVAQPGGTQTFARKTGCP